MKNEEQNHEVKNIPKGEEHNSSKSIVEKKALLAENLRSTARKDNLKHKERRMTKTINEATTSSPLDQLMGNDIQNKHDGGPSGFIIDPLKEDIENEKVTDSLLYIPGKSCITKFEPSAELTDNDELFMPRIQQPTCH